MPTSKRRVTINLDEDLEAFLTKGCEEAGFKSFSGYITNTLRSVVLPGSETIVQYGGKRSGAGRKKPKKGGSIDV